MIPVSTQIKLNELAQKFGQRLLTDVQRAFEKYSRSGALAESAELTITKATATEAPKIIITYADQGFFINQRNPQWTKQPDVSKLEEWAKDVQFSGPIPGYKNGLAPNLPPWKANERRLWAIAKSKQKFDTHKRKPWKRDAKLGAFLAEMNTVTLDAYRNEVEKLLTDALEGRSTS
jgi:hypothetical protein